MAAPSYTTDLADISTCESSTSWTEPTGFTAGTLAAETDYWIQTPGSGTTHCISKSMGASAPASSGAIFDSGSGKTIPSPGAFMIWLFFGAPNALASQASGGMQIFCGSSGANFQQWYVRGADTYPYGGWVCVPVDPSVSESTHTGTPSGTKQFFGAAAYIPSIAVSKGSPFGVDVVRYGRCEARIADGSTADGYATFAGLVATNDIEANRWGLLQSVQGGYLMQGLIVLGYSTACDFRDSNKNIFIANTEKVVSNFNAIEVRQAGSRVDMNAVSITSLGTTSRGNWITTDNADINIDGCTFTDMGTFGYLSNSTINTSTFRRCNLITQGGATFNGCTIDSTNDSAKAMIASNPATISNCTFISSGTKHAIEITTPGTYTFANNSFTGYATSNGSTGNEVIYNNSSGAVTLNVTGTGTGTISYMNGSGATTTVSSSASLTINIVDETGTAITANSEVTVVKNSDTSILFEEDGIVDGSTTYSYSSGGGTVVYINVFNVAGYQPKTVNNYTLPSSGTTTLTIQLDTERFYSNP